MSTESGDIAQELNVANKELAELTDLLKKLHRMSWGNDTWLYWDDVDSWVVRQQPYRSRTQRVLYEGPSLLAALRVLVEGKG